MNYISLVIKYDDNAVQTWNYDFEQFNTIDDVKANMAADFVDPRFDRKTVVIRVSGIKGLQSPIEVPIANETEMDFVDLVFNEIDKRTK